MPASETQLKANLANANKSTGPKTSEGKTISRQNALKHGLAGRGIVTPEADQEEIACRVERLNAEMNPRTPTGVVLIVQMATLSVRMERGAQQELAALAMHVRHAEDDFDEERIDRANALFEALGEDPRSNLRKIKKMPEGVDRLIDEWQDLRADLHIDPKPLWTADHLERAANMTGLKTQHARGSQLGSLSKAFWGDIGTLADDEADIDEDFQRDFAKAQLIERIDAEIAVLEAHRETLDFELIELDRAGAGARALFDPSREATLARRYEAEARRGFYKAYKEFQQIEAAATDRVEAVPPPPPLSELASSRERPPQPTCELIPGVTKEAKFEVPVAKGSNGRSARPRPPAKLRA
jgi:hypothetical protein